jgi:hypothetical protein
MVLKNLMPNMKEGEEDEEDGGEDDDDDDGKVEEDGGGKFKRRQPKRVRSIHKQYSSNATKIVATAQKNLQRDIAKKMLTHESLATFQTAVFVEAEVWWAKIREANPSSTAGKGPKQKGGQGDLWAGDPRS